MDVFLNCSFGLLSLWCFAMYLAVNTIGVKPSHYMC